MYPFYQRISRPLTLRCVDCRISYASRIRSKQQHLPSPILHRTLPLNTDLRTAGIHKLNALHPRPRPLPLPRLHRLRQTSPNRICPPPHVAYFAYGWYGAVSYFDRMYSLSVLNSLYTWIDFGVARGRKSHCNRHQDRPRRAN